MEAESPASSFATVTPSVLAKLNEKDRSSWQRVYEKYNGILRSDLFSFWRASNKEHPDPNPEVIDEVVEATWEKLLPKLRNFTIKQGGGFRCYVRNAARNNLVNNWRKSRRRDAMKERLKDGWIPSVSSKGSSLDIELKDYADLIRQCAQRLQDAGKVSQEHLNIFFEACKGDLSPTEIACLYGTSSANVNQIKCRVSQMIRERLGAASE